MVKSKAAVAFEPGKPLEIVEIDVEDPKAGEVMIKIEFTSLCHTDIYSVSGNDPSASFPFIPGHEAAGVVVKVGEGVTNVKVGDHVIPTWKPECGECEYCQRGLNFCSAVSDSQGKGVLRDGTSRFSYQGQPISHFMGISSFSEYIVVNDINVCPIPEEAPMDKVCLLGCGVTTGLKSVDNDVQVEEGATAAVFGVGTIGLAVIQGLVGRKASRIIAVDINDDKEQVAKEFGATEFINASKIDKPIQEYIIDLTNGGVDYSFACVGHIDTMNAALECTHKGWGKSVVIGVASGQDRISTRPFQLITGREWRGSSYGGVTGVTGLRALVEDYLDGKIELDHFITHHMKIEDINEAIELQEKGQSLRDILTF